MPEKLVRADSEVGVEKDFQGVLLERRGGMTAGAKKKAGEKREYFYNYRRIATGSWGCGRAP
jgi:hypothetical protein